MSFFRKTVEKSKETLLDRLNARPIPDLGDSRKTYAVELTEPEINAIYSAVAYIKANCAAVSSRFGGRPMKYWEHFGPTLTALSDRLADFDDGNAPYSGTANASQPGPQAHSGSTISESKDKQA